MENVCIELKNGKFWVSKEGDRHDLPARLQLTSYREHPRVHKVTYHEYDPYAPANATMAVYINNPSFLFKRIGPRNMMHAFHDDLIPLIATISNLEEFAEDELKDDLLAVAVDGSNFLLDPYGPFEVIGHAMEMEQIPYKVAGPFKDKEIKHICFERAYVGLETSTTWYHYGYNEMQGPIKEAKGEFVGSNVRLITGWISERLGEIYRKDHAKLEAKYQGALATPKEYFEAWRNGKTIPGASKPLISVIIRSKSRKILNEAELVKDLHEAFPEAIIQALDEERRPHHELIYLTRRSVAMIGMHGALLSMAMFLPPGAVLIEAFPFGIPTENYTPYKTLAELPAYQLQYHAWSNPYEEAPYNQGHPEQSLYYGGLRHLPASYAAGVLATKTVPKHPCCYSPFWIYRIFQDTWIDSNEVIKLIRRG